jgi:hypothetical protein
VRLVPAGALIDAVEVRAAMADNPGELSIERLRALTSRFRGEFLDGLERPELGDFQAWRVALREAFRQLHRRLLSELVDRQQDSPEAALAPARELVRLRPDDEASRARLVTLLARSGRREEAEEHFMLGCKQMDRTGVDHRQLKPAWQAIVAELANEFQLVRYDQRGNGLSDWDVSDFSLQAGVSDLEAVVDAAGLERFPLLGISGGAAGLHQAGVGARSAGFQADLLDRFHARRHFRADELVQRVTARVDEPAFARFLWEIRAFLASDHAATGRSGRKRTSLSIVP